MNEAVFDDHIRAAMTPASLPEGLRQEIDGRVNAHVYRAGRVRKWKLGTSIAAVGVLAIVLFPVAQAQVVLARMAGALDGVAAVRMQRYNMLDDGSRAWAGTVDYERGKWRVTGPAESYHYLDGKSYRYDALTESYVVEDRPDGPFAHNSRSLVLSSVLDQARGWGRSVRLTETRDAIVATIEDPDLGERTVVTADKETMLPVRIEGYSRELGQWRLRSVMVTEYSPRFEVGHFALQADVPVVTKDDYEKRMVEALTTESLLTFETADGVFKLRSVEVAADGTVFVTYQIGERSRKWRGFRLRVTDDLGNEYTYPGMLDGGYYRFPKYSVDGRLELEVFVPLNPTSAWRARTIRLEAAMTRENEIVQWISSGIGSQRVDGTAWFSIYPNTSGVDRENPPPWKEIWASRFEVPTCDLNPGYVTYLDYQSFGNDVYARIYRASALARHFQNAQDWQRAEQWLLQDLRLKKESESRGYGTWSLDQALMELDAVRRHLRID